MTFLLKASTLLLAGCPTLAFASGIPHSLNDNVISCNAESGCSTITMSGRNYQIIRTDRFTVMVAISTEAHYTRADISILNTTGLQQNLSPQDFRVEVISPKPKVLSYISPANLKEIATKPPTASETGKSKRHESAANPDTKMSLSGNTVSQEALAEIANLQETQQHLEATSIQPSQTIRGKVYFQRDGSARLMNVMLPISGMVFEFPYSPKH